MATEYFRTKITANLPVRVQRADTWWEIKMREGEREDKLHLCAVRESDGKEFIFLTGHLSYLYEAVKVGMGSSPGMIRHDLFIALAASGLAEMKQMKGPYDWR